MFSLDGGLRYWLYSEPTDMRKSFHYEAGGMVIYAKMLVRGTFGMPIPGSKDVVTSSIKWEDLLKMVEGILSNPDSRQARLDELKNMWKK